MPHPSSRKSTGRLPLRLLVAICAFASAEARAGDPGEIDLLFDLSGSSFSILGGALLVPPDGSIYLGVANLLVPGDAIDEPVAGTGTIPELRLAATVSGSVLGQVDVSGSIAIENFGPIGVVLEPGEMDLSLGPLTLDVDASLDCSGSAPACAQLGLPVAVMGIESITLVGTLPIEGLDQVGSARVSGDIEFDLDGVAGVLSLDGVELDRMFVPEPGSTVLMVAALGTVARLRRASLSRPSRPLERSPRRASCRRS